MPGCQLCSATWQRMWKKIDTNHIQALVCNSKWKNKEQSLVFSSRGIHFTARHLMENLRMLMPHSKADLKWVIKIRYLWWMGFIKWRTAVSVSILKSKRNNISIWSFKFHLMDHLQNYYSKYFIPLPK